MAVFQFKNASLFKKCCGQESISLFRAKGWSNGETITLNELSSSDVKAMLRW
jgi:hypothetical protein